MNKENYESTEFQSRNLPQTPGKLCHQALQKALTLFRPAARVNAAASIFPHPRPARPYIPFRKWLIRSQEVFCEDHTGRRALDWLFARARQHKRLVELDTDLIIRPQTETDPLPEILYSLSDIGLVPVQLHRPIEAGSVLVHFDNVGERDIQRAAQRLLRLQGIGHVAYRSGTRAGGLLVACPQA